MKTPTASKPLKIQKSMMAQKYVYLEQLKKNFKYNHYDECNIYFLTILFAFYFKDYNISRSRNHNDFNKTPSKPKRVSLSSQANDLFSLRQISKKFSTSMPELLDENIVNKKNEHEWTNLISDKLSVKKRNNSVDSLQVRKNLVHKSNKQKI